MFCEMSHGDVTLQRLCDVEKIGRALSGLLRLHNALGRSLGLHQPHSTSHHPHICLWDKLYLELLSVDFSAEFITLSSYHYLLLLL